MFSALAVTPSPNNWQDVIINLATNYKSEDVTSAIRFIRSQAIPFSEVVVGFLEYRNIKVCFCPGYKNRRSCKLFKIVQFRNNNNMFCEICDSHASRKSLANYAHLNTTESCMPEKFIHDKLRTTKEELFTTKRQLSITKVTIVNNN